MVVKNEEEAEILKMFVIALPPDEQSKGNIWGHLKLPDLVYAEYVVCKVKYNWDNYLTYLVVQWLVYP